MIQNHNARTESGATYIGCLLIKNSKQICFEHSASPCDNEYKGQFGVVSFLYGNFL